MRALLALPLLLAPACGPTDSGAGRGPRLVVLVGACSLGSNHLGAYDPALELTPNLDALAREGVVFEHHVTEAGQSGTAFASIVTGSQAYRHGIYRHPKPLADDLYLITEAFADGGYTPWFWDGHRMASMDLAYGQGVAAEHALTVRGRGQRTQRDVLHEGDPDFRRLLDGLEGDPGERAFVLATFTLNHHPYHKQLGRGGMEAFLDERPELAQGVALADLQRYLPLFDEHALALQWNFAATVAELGLAAAEVERLVLVLEVAYQATVVELDRVLGRLTDTLRERGLLEDTLIAITADHGEQLYRENALFQWTHGLELAPEVLRVPWIVRGPGIDPGRYPGVTRSIDVFPTLAGLCGLELPRDTQIEGVDLSGVLVDGDAPPELLAYSHTTTVGPETLELFAPWEHVLRFFPRTDPELMWVSAFDGERLTKLRNLDGTSWGLTVFDLVTDPGETTNLHDPEDAAQARTRLLLERYKATLVERYDVVGAGALTGDEALQRLRDLGYVR